MPVRAFLTTKGLEKWLEDLAAAGQDVDAAAGRSLQAGAEVAQAGMIERAPELTGNLKGKIVVGEVKQDGNYISIEIGLLGADADTARYGNAQEFGTSDMAAQPYIRPTLDEDKAKIMAAERKVLQEAGKL